MINEKFVNRSLSILYRYGQRYFTHKLKSCSLPLEVGQLPCIIQIYRFPGITQDMISGKAVMDKGTTARAVKQLEKSGLVVRKIDEKDRRIYHIFPTQKALDIKDQVFGILKELHEILYRGLNEEEIIQTSSLLCRMQSNIADYLEQPPFSQAEASGSGNQIEKLPTDENS